MLIPLGQSFQHADLAVGLGQCQPPPLALGTPVLALLARLIQLFAEGLLALFEQLEFADFEHAGMDGISEGLRQLIQLVLNLFDGGL